MSGPKGFEDDVLNYTDQLDGIDNLQNI